MHSIIVCHIQKHYTLPKLLVDNHRINSLWQLPVVYPASRKQPKETHVACQVTDVNYE